MGYKDLHDEPFDEGTLVKLEIFEDYLQAWLPTFLMQAPLYPVVCIFDFFAGTGFDKDGIAGSPIRFLNKLNEQVHLITQKKVRIKLYLNEFNLLKFNQLKEACDTYLQDKADLHDLVEISYFNEDFEVLFPTLIPAINRYPSLVYLDQNGMRFLSESYLQELEKMKQTDFLYFISSSFFWRFGDSKEFKKHLDIDMAAAKKDPYKFIHRNIIEQLRLKLSSTSKLKLYPFSIKKVANIHGIIFGATHPRAVDKFLALSWKRNQINGEANFDIDEDAKKAGLLDLWGNTKLTKIEQFQESVRQKVLDHTIRNNKEALDYTYNQGHLPSHAADCIKLMKKNKEVEFSGSSPLVTYQNVYTNNNILIYHTVK